VLYLRLIILSVRDDVPIDSEALLVTDFMNLKIKLTQSFRCTRRGRVCVHVFIGVSARMSIRVCLFLKKYGPRFKLYDRRKIRGTQSDPIIVANTEQFFHKILVIKRYLRWRKLAKAIKFFTGSFICNFPRIFYYIRSARRIGKSSRNK
jgi:hypothetical protein